MRWLCISTLRVYQIEFGLSIHIKCALIFHAFIRWTFSLLFLLMGILSSCDVNIYGKCCFQTPLSIRNLTVLLITRNCISFSHAGHYAVQIMAKSMALHKVYNAKPQKDLVNGWKLEVHRWIEMCMSFKWVLDIICLLSLTSGIMRNSVIKGQFSQTVLTMAQLIRPFVDWFWIGLHWTRDFSSDMLCNLDSMATNKVQKKRMKLNLICL